MTLRLFRYIYTGIFILLFPLILIRLLWKSRFNPAYRQRLNERIGFSSLRLKQSIWIHAVSVGESIAAIALIKKWLSVSEAYPIVVTCMTPTGSEQLSAAFKKELGHRVFHVYVPYDVPFIINRFIKRINPHLLILMETEIWPNMLYSAHIHNVPTLIANGRLSPRSFKAYQRFQPITRSCVQLIKQIGTQSHLDETRFINLGVPAASVTVTGNIKFDIQFSKNQIKAGDALRAQLGKNKPVWIAASTHEGEELAILSAFKEIKKNIPKLILILVPRHPERFNKVYQLCLDTSFKTQRRSDVNQINEVDIYLGDTMGEMGAYYSASDVAFVGGSLVPIGGHNLLEPVAVGVPVITGPFCHNFLYIRDTLLDAKGLVAIEGSAQLINAVQSILLNQDKAKLLKDNASKVLEANKGATARTIDLANHLIHQT